MATKWILVRDLKIGDEVMVGPADGGWSFKIAALEPGRIATKIKDHRGITWREPAPMEKIKIWVEHNHRTGDGMARLDCPACASYVE